MAIQTIGYANKVTLNENTDVADVNKVKANDMNEIKSVVNNNAAELENLFAVVLFNDANGDNGSITLSDNVENYDYIEIFYRNNDNFYSSRKFYQPSEKKLVLDSYYVAATNIVFKMNYITISGTSVTRNQFIEASKNNMTQNTTTANTYITRIIGYK